MALRVATINIWNRMGPWEERLAALRRELGRLSADVVGVQEVLVLDFDGTVFHQGELLAEALGYHVVYGRHPEAVHPMGNAILSRWPVRRSETFPLPMVGTDEYRSLVFAELDAPFGPLPVFCTHLNWKLHESAVRQAQVRFVADRIAELAPISGFPPVLVGDMNAEPDSDEMRFLRGLTAIEGRSVYFADTFGVVGDGTPGFTYARTNPFAAVMREPSRRIDYVFVRGPDEQGRGEPLEARLCFHEPLDGVHGSDHYGVVATISTE